MKKRNLKNWIPGLQVSAAISFLLFLYAPIDLYCANTAEFWFDFSTLLITALGMFAACFAVLAVLYLIAMLIHPYVYRITLAGGIALFICTYIQGNFMIDRLPPLDGTSIWWGKYDILRKDTLLLWVVVLIVVIAAMIVLRKQKFVHVVMFISGCMTLMLLVTACSTVITSGALHSKLHLHVSVEEEFEMSADNNFVILVLDTADSREFTSLLEEHPEYREIFGDFTYFDKLLQNEENKSNDNKITFENKGSKIVAQGLVTVLSGQLGNNNDDKKYGFSTDAWCAQFTTWALKQVSVQGQTLYSYINAAGPINDNSASGMWPAFRSGANSNITFEYSKAYGGSYTPKAGDIIFYQWTNGECRSSYGKWDKVRKCSDHVGIVTSSDSSNVYTIEGNTGEPGLVRKRTRNINSDEIVAYGSWYK